MRSITEALDGKGKPVKRQIPFGDSGRNKRRKAQNLKMRELAGANNGSTLWRFGLLNDNQNENNDNNNICETLTFSEKKSEKESSYFYCIHEESSFKTRKIRSAHLTF